MTIDEEIKMLTERLAELQKEKDKVTLNMMKMNFGKEWMKEKIII